jgi:hypothetical protein
LRHLFIFILAYGKLHERSIIIVTKKKILHKKKVLGHLVSFLLKIKINKRLLKVNQSAYSGADRDDFFKPSLWYLLFFFHLNKKSLQTQSDSEKEVINMMMI